MPKSNRSATLLAYAQLDKQLTVSNGKLFCSACSKIIIDEKLKKSTVENHLNSQIHQKNAANTTVKQMTIYNSVNNKVPFQMEVCAFMIENNIPFKKITKPSFRRFFSKLRSCPSESGVRQELHTVYYTYLDKIKEKLSNGYLYVSVDETTDCLRYATYIIMVGVLDTNFRSYVIDVHRELYNANAENTTRIVMKSLNEFFGVVPFDRIILYLTDGAQYMKKSYTQLKPMFPTFLHVTCSAHALHNMMVNVFEEYPMCEDVITMTKNLMTKSKERKHDFKKKYPKIPLPPEPCRTRWGKMLCAVQYYMSNLDKVKEFVDGLDAQSSRSFVDKLKLALKDENLPRQLAQIWLDYQGVLPTIQLLEKRELKTTEALAAFFGVIEALSDNSIKEKMVTRIKKNKGLLVLARAIGFQLPAELNVECEQQFSPEIIAAFMCAPITTTAVERCFSLYNNILTKHRLSFTEENLRLYAFININSSLLEDDITLD